MVPLVIAHRGDSAHFPENTRAAFESALRLGADLVELDVQLTKDGHVVVMHDGSVDRTTNGKGKLRDLTLAEVKRLSAGFPERFAAKHEAERVLSLGEALQLLRGRTRVMIELKKESIGDADDEALEAKVVAAVREARMEKDVALISFERRALLRCRALAPEIRRGHLFYRATPEELVAGAREIDSDLVMPEKGMLSDEVTAALHAADIKCATWVVDEAAELRALARFDLYGVGSNCPGVLLEAIWEGA